MDYLRGNRKLRAHLHSRCSSPACFVLKGRKCAITTKDQWKNMPEATFLQNDIKSLLAKGGSVKETKLFGLMLFKIALHPAPSA